MLKFEKKIRRQKVKEDEMDREKISVYGRSNQRGRERRWAAAALHKRKLKNKHIQTCRPYNIKRFACLTFSQNQPLKFWKIKRKSLEVVGELKKNPEVWTSWCKQYEWIMEHVKVQQSLYKTWGFQDVEVNRFQENRHLMVVRLSVPRNGHLYPPGNTPGTHFC